MAKSYAVETGRFVEKPFEIIRNFGPAGALSATGTDMVRFGQAILERRRARRRTHHWRGNARQQMLKPRVLAR